jgi:UrcA family protein
MGRKAFIVAALVTVLGLGQAQAAELWQVGNNSYVVRANPAELQTPAGRADLLLDIERAAQRACRAERTRGRILRCRAQQTAAMEAQLNVASRTMVHLARTERGNTHLAGR